MHCRALRVAAVLAAGLGAASCGSKAPVSSPTVPAALTGRITVFAAASLTDGFEEIETAFEAANPGTDVVINFAGSSTLVTQIINGAPADVFASADAANMKRLTDASLAAAAPVDFARNALQIIVPKCNPKNITSLADLAGPDIVYVSANPDVPVAIYAKQVLDKANVTVTPRSLEADVKGIVTKVTLGEADAGIVYATDVKAAGTAAAGVAIPDEVNVVATYPIAATKSAANAAGAEAFVNYVAGSAGSAILAEHGFSAPTARPWPT